MPAQERLITCASIELIAANISDITASDYSCSYWKGSLPKQGWIYVSSNYMCFHALMMGRDFTVAIPYCDIVSIERASKVFLTDEVVVNTRDDEVRDSL